MGLDDVACVEIDFGKKKSDRDFTTKIENFGNARFIFSKVLVKEMYDLPAGV